MWDTATIEKYNLHSTVFYRPAHGKSIAIIAEGKASKKVQNQLLQILKGSFVVAFAGGLVVSSLTFVENKTEIERKCLSPNNIDYTIGFVNGKSNNKCLNLYEISEGTFLTLCQNQEKLEEIKNEFIKRNGLNSEETQNLDFANHQINKAMIEELEYIKINYQENWNGEGSKPINDKVYQNALSVIKKCNPQSLAKWEISLNNNGSLYFSGIEDDAMINLGNYTFSYYVKINGKKLSSANSEKYTAKALINVLELI